MAIVGFNYTRMSSERKAPLKGKIDIKNNVAIKSVEKKSMPMGSKPQDVLEVTFHYTSIYDANKKEAATTDLEGNVLILEDTKKIQEYVENWKKSKKLDDKLSITLMNTILRKCNIQSLLLSKEMNIPPPVPLPRVQSKADASKYIG